MRKDGSGTVDERDFLVERKGTRRMPQVGDVVALELARDPHRGRFIHAAVARADLEFLGPGHGRYFLLYIHSSLSDSPENVPRIGRDSLLVPPIVTVRQGWLRGAFIPVGRQEELEVPPVHSFYKVSSDTFVDEGWAPLAGPIGDVGWAGVWRYQGVGELIMNALAHTQIWPKGSPRPGAKLVSWREQ